MYFASGYPYSAADTVCIDLDGSTSAALTYQYTWNGTYFLSPSVQVSTDGGGASGTWIDLQEYHDPTGIGECREMCLAPTTPPPSMTSSCW